MSSDQGIDDFLDKITQLKVSLRRLIEDYNDCVKDLEDKPKHNQALFILKNKYEMLDLIHSEIRYLAADTIKEGMSKA